MVTDYRFAKIPGNYRYQALVFIAKDAGTDKKIIISNLINWLL